MSLLENYTVFTENKSKNKNGGPKEDRGVCVWCEDLKLDNIGLLNLW